MFVYHQIMKILMKILLTTIFVILFTTITNAQLNGLGDFKLNKTKVDYVVTKYPTFLEITDSTDYPLTRRFYCEKYKILDVYLKHIYLTFYNDYLVDFESDREKLIETYLVLKYGRPVIQQFFSTVQMDNTIYNEDRRIFQWNGDDSIKIVSTYTKRYNNYFNVVVDSYLYIYMMGNILKK